MEIHNIFVLFFGLVGIILATIILIYTVRACCMLRKQSRLLVRLGRDQITNTATASGNRITIRERTPDNFQMILLERLGDERSRLIEDKKALREENKELVKENAMLKLTIRNLKRERDSLKILALLIIMWVNTY